MMKCSLFFPQGPREVLHAGDRAGSQRQAGSAVLGSTVSVWGEMEN
jgi:hypothetical protein